jgi:hypothetical protein
MSKGWNCAARLGHIAVEANAAAETPAERAQGVESLVTATVVDATEVMGIGDLDDDIVAFPQD